MWANADAGAGLDNKAADSNFINQIRVFLQKFRTHAAKK